jgi:hypothetical protein
MNEKIIELRVHTELIEPTKETRQKPSRDDDEGSRWPASVLLVDCETTIDARQSLTFGGYQYCRWKQGRYEPVETGVFYNEAVSVDDLAILRQYAEAHHLKLYARVAFIKRVFWRSVRAQALIVCFNAPFDLSRIASDGVWTPRLRGGWSFTMTQYRDKDGTERENVFTPRLIITPKDGKGAFFRLTKAGTPKGWPSSEPFPPIRVLDLKTLSWALENRSHGLQSACEARSIPGKLDHKPTGLITREELDYNAGDLRASLSLLNALRGDFDMHPLDSLSPDHTYSPATFAKAYLTQFGITPPLQKFDLPPWVLGVAMESYYGGRAECRIRHTDMPIVYTDFLSQYPTVNTLLDLFRLLIAERLEIQEATDDVRRLLAGVTMETVLSQAFWKDLTFFALVEPDGDVLPVRTTYNDATSNIGVNPLTSKTPIWYAGPDLVAATLRSGKPPKVLRAIRITPVGQQTGLRPVRLRRAVEIDPRTDDFFKRVIEARAQAKHDHSLSPAERDVLRLFLKILANAGSYGLFVEVNPERVDNDPKTGQPKRANVRVWHGEQSFPTTSDIVERPGSWYCPILASLITAGGRLLLGTLESMVTDAGGSYLMCDTDSMAIVASEHGGLVSCVGGPYRLPDGRDAVNALRWTEVNHIVDRIDALSPYDRSAVHERLLKIEDVNRDESGQQREVHGYAIAAKRYALFTRSADGDLQIVKASGHGLGYLYRPKDGFNKALEEHEWVIEAWDWLIRQALGLPSTVPSWFSLPAMMRIAVTTPEVLKALQERQRGLPYADRVKPFNFVLSPLIDPFGGHPQGATRDKFTLIAPFTSKASSWLDLEWVNYHEDSGTLYRLARPGHRRPSDAEAKTYGDVVKDYRWHEEAKSLGPDGRPCRDTTAGLLQRMPVQAAAKFRHIGKETDRRWEREDDISLLNPRLVEYRPQETARLTTDPTLQQRARRHSIRDLAKAAGVTEKAVKALRRGGRFRKATARKIEQGLILLDARARESKPIQRRPRRARPAHGRRPRRPLR